MPKAQPPVGAIPVNRREPEDRQRKRLEQQWGCVMKRTYGGKEYWIRCDK
jgi:hypothetical protein